MLYLPGYSGGDALADILFGDVNPSGKLPISYPKYPHSLFNYYRKTFDDYNPLFEFGFGLSYTTFNYSNLSVSSDNEVINVSVTVTNTGNVSGKEAVQLYTSDLVASSAPDAKRLRKFKKVELESNESITLEFQLTPLDLSFINEDNKRVTEKGDFEIQIADLKARFALT
uniref:beta-glucosidase n=1 Tax=Coptotermes formosanus TaxID=36987 RepID=R4UJ45_COPFO|nr:beta-glycosidase [Coptotermes formosanus]